MEPYTQAASGLGSLFSGQKPPYFVAWAPSLLGPNLLLSAPGGVAMSQPQVSGGRGLPRSSGKLFNMLDREAVRDTPGPENLW